MIGAAMPGFAALARRLLDRARRNAEARAAGLVRTRRNDPSRWRDARYLWPDLTQER